MTQHVPTNEMILGDFFLEEFSLCHMTYSGMDSPIECMNPTQFEQYPHPIEYHYNSRGFRDQEWPTSLAELKDAVWVVGDSFTAGVGSPVAHTWPGVLAKYIRHRVINVSMDGASNDWISRHARAIVDHVAPRAVIVMWSYLHRSESADLTLTDCDRRQHFVQENIDPWEVLKNFEKCVALLENTGVYWCAVPEFHCSWTSPPGNPDEIKHWRKYKSISARLGVPIVEEIHRLDLARDGHHFDVITAEWLVQRVLAAIAPALAQPTVASC